MKFFAPTLFLMLVLLVGAKAEVWTSRDGQAKCTVPNARRGTQLLFKVQGGCDDAGSCPLSADDLKKFCTQVKGTRS
ncbi:uncharacterized protein PFL1_04230 [Pseudozyma flocculosa PF-1]|uniref:Secreted protein n=1 Tax=Pseudozyma flocculosa PF-1 TaxID=1277687 RepID=A0A061H714_9BASI|nr:uncharacterized protein PFL1_04230 [Pseudozyma flocculosa PF-1]EPQ28403.1 hypothetical protein PFL1_04230 [Pseudozyma flocculosa PF-1]